MNPAPLPQPAPFTCPPCGAGLESKSGLCPRCGARLDETKRSPLSLATVIGASAGLLVFGAIGACGGSLVVEAFGPHKGWGSPPGPISASDLLIFSVPCLVLGLIGFAFCLRALPKLKRATLARCLPRLCLSPHRSPVLVVARLCANFWRSARGAAKKWSRPPNAFTLQRALGASLRFSPF
jgi:hypothetical protein